MNQNTLTQRGKYKELYYEKNKDKFAEYSDKIIHDNNATLKNGPRDDGLPNSWSNEREQRFYGTKGIVQLNLADDDIIIVSDLDEIVDKNTLKKNKINNYSHTELSHFGKE